MKRALLSSDAADSAALVKSFRVVLLSRVGLPPILVALGPRFSAHHSLHLGRLVRSFTYESSRLLDLSPKAELSEDIPS
jgi:hypothetical protein